MSDQQFVDMLNFLWHIDEGSLFENIDRQHLMPLVSNIDKKKYSYGEYIQREGEIPEGLMIIHKGQAVICKENIAMRKLSKEA